MSAKLLVDGPGMWAFAHPLAPGRTVRVGRTPENELRLNDRAVSGKHAEIYEVAGTWYVRDAGSSNGTFVNGKKVRDTALKEGDVVKFGKCEVVFFAGLDNGDSSERTWDETKIEMERDATALREIIEHGSEGGGASIPSFIGKAKSPLPVEKEVGIESSPSHRVKITSVIPPSSSALIPAPAPRKDEPAAASELSSADTLWVAARLSAIVGDLVRVAAEDREQALVGILKHLIDALEADNAFVMIAEPTTNRWVIRASIGNTESWTGYEKDHPVPLTVANRAYTSKKAISNALDGGEGAGFDNSSSMMLLNVQNYIAVPLLAQEKRRGVLYFDTRQQGGKRFERKHLKLLERVGGYILDVERQ